MSVFGFMKRLIMAQPLFDEQPHVQGATPVSANQPPLSSIRKNDASTFPVLQITRTETHESGSHVQIYCHIRNESTEQLILDKIRLLGTSRQMTANLQPHDEQEYLVYEGPQLQTDAYHDAQLDYRTAAGDYFEAYHDVTYEYQDASKTYTIDEMNLRLPIRDIYG